MRILGALLIALVSLATSCQQLQNSVGERSTDFKGTQGAAASATGQPGSIAGGVFDHPSAGNLMLRARELLDSGRAEEALKAYQQAASLGYTGHDIHFYLGRCHQDLGDQDNMLRELQEYLRQADPNTNQAKQAAEIVRKTTAEQKR